MLQRGLEPIPGYRLEEFLGSGGFGEVWRASAAGGSMVALKLVELNNQQGLKELRALHHYSNLGHANLMPLVAWWVLDKHHKVVPLDLENLAADAVDDTTYQTLVTAMLLAEENLHDCLRRHQAQGSPGIPVGLLLEYMEEAAKGLDYLASAMSNERGSIQHCDVKPQNIMLRGGSVQVCDFGLARSLNDLRQTTSLCGSPHYLPPELISGNPTPTSDQYSLALTYTELRVGAHPLQGAPPMAAFAAHKQGTIELNDLSDAERPVIRKALSGDPASRFDSCLEMVRALRRVVSGSDESSVHMPAAIPPNRGAAPNASAPVGRFPREKVTIDLTKLPRSQPPPIPARQPSKRKNIERKSAPEAFRPANAASVDWQQSPTVLIGAVASAVVLVTALLAVIYFVSG